MTNRAERIILCCGYFMGTSIYSGGIIVFHKSSQIKSGEAGLEPAAS